MLVRPSRRLFYGGMVKFVSLSSLCRFLNIAQSCWCHRHQADPYSFASFILTLTPSAGHPVKLSFVLK